MLKKFLVAFAILTLMTLVFIGCNTEVEQVDAPAVSATPTMEPQYVQISVELTPEPTAVPTPTPTPTPEPTPVPPPTPIPFSYYAPTVNMTFEELIGSTGDCYKDDDEINWPKGYPEAGTYKIVVDLYWQVVKIYSKDANGEYTVPVRYMLCSTGSAKLGQTREGVFKMQKCRIRYGEFKYGDAAQYWTLIYSRTYFHSVLYERKDLNTYDVDAYNSLGTKVSHGCIRLPVPDARWIWFNIAYGTDCEIVKGSESDTETRMIREQLILPPAPTERINIVEGAAPWTDNWTVEGITDLSVPFENEAPRRPDSSISSSASNESCDDGSCTDEDTDTSSNAGNGEIPELP